MLRSGSIAGWIAPRACLIKASQLFELRRAGPWPLPCHARWGCNPIRQLSSRGERFSPRERRVAKGCGRGRAMHAVAVSRDVMAWSRGAGAQRGKQWANRKKILFGPNAHRMAHGSALASPRGPCAHPPFVRPRKQPDRNGTTLHHSASAL